MFACRLIQALEQTVKEVEDCGKEWRGRVPLVTKITLILIKRVNTKSETNPSLNATCVCSSLWTDFNRSMFFSYMTWADTPLLKFLSCKLFPVFFKFYFPPPPFFVARRWILRPGSKLDMMISYLIFFFLAKLVGMWSRWPLFLHNRNILCNLIFLNAQ